MESGKLFIFLFAHSHRYFDGPYGPSSTPTQLCWKMKNPKTVMSNEAAKCHTNKRFKNLIFLVQ